MPMPDWAVASTTSTKASQDCSRSSSQKACAGERCMVRMAANAMTRLFHWMLPVDGAVARCCRLLWPSSFDDRVCSTMMFDGLEVKGRLWMVETLCLPPSLDQCGPAMAGNLGSFVDCMCKGIIQVRNNKNKSQKSSSTGIDGKTTQQHERKMSGRKQPGTSKEMTTDTIHRLSISKLSHEGSTDLLNYDDCTSTSSFLRSNHSREMLPF